MWFDVRAKLAELKGDPAATSATIATPTTFEGTLSQKSQVSQPMQYGAAGAHVAEVANVARVEPRAPTATGPHKAEDVDALALTEDDPTFDIFEERAAILQYDGDQEPRDADCAALAEVAALFGITTSSLRQRWLAHPDAQACLAFFVSHGPMPLTIAAAALGWPLRRAWSAESRLRACGLLRQRG